MENGTKNNQKLQEKFKWFAVATAPRDYPMEISRGEFLFKGANYGPSLPSGGTLTTGWGKVASSYGADSLMPLPDRLVVEFFSYPERQFYRGEFALPYELIVQKFNELFLADGESNPTGRLLAGVAPGGAVAVWVAGQEKHEVFFGQAEKINRSPSVGFGLPFSSQEDADKYISEAMAGRVTPEQLHKIKTEGAPIGAWARYRNRYKWVPVFAQGKPVVRPTMPATLLNGEFFTMPTQFSEAEANTPKPLPSELSFRIQVTNDQSAHYAITFEPVELMAAFEKLGAHGEKVFMEFDAYLPATILKIKLYNDSQPKDDKTPKEVIELKKFKLDS